MSKPFFSVVVPTWNRDYVVWKAIQSVLSQTFASLELLVLDDGSTDHTQRLLEEFSDPRVQTERLPHGGQSRTRNYGLRRARGKYIAYLDSDNTWEPLFLETFHKAIQSEQKAIYYCGRQKIFYARSGNHMKVTENRFQPYRQFSLEEIWKLHAPDTNSLVHSKQAGLDIGGWDERCSWLEDWDFFLRLCLAHPYQWQWIDSKHLVTYRQIHGDGADGICAIYRKDQKLEKDARRYLIQKWQSHQSFDPRVLAC